jgi:hypothetical protein
MAMQLEKPSLLQKLLELLVLLLQVLQPFHKTYNRDSYRQTREAPKGVFFMENYASIFCKQ